MSIDERIERLERDNRMLRRLAVIPLLAATAALLMGQAPAQKVIEAQRFALIDPSGKVVGGLSAGDRGPSLTFFDTTGLRLSLSPDSLILYDRGGEVRYLLRVRDDGNLATTMFDAKGEGRINLRVAPEGSARVVVTARDGKPEALGGH